MSKKTLVPITEQEIIEAAIEQWVAENPGKEIPTFSVNSHQEYGREYLEALPDDGHFPDAPRFFADFYKLVEE
jgi:hypothetical protein